MHRTKIVILGTGGTIAGQSSDPSDQLGYVAAEIGVALLVAGVPGLSAKHEFLVEQVAQLDSKDMCFDVWVLLAQRVTYFLERDDVVGIVITHGTDTLEETAYFLHALLGPDKPVVLTCAMRPASALSPDGPQNLRDAVTLVGTLGARGVMVVCAGVVHGALEVQKRHTYRLDAFTSGDAGPMAYVEDNKVRFIRNIAGVGLPRSFIATKKIAELHAHGCWPSVEVVMNYVGAGGDVVRALVASGVRGMVLAGTGNGTAHKELEAALRAAQAVGIRVIRATRCASGRVLSVPGDPLEDSQGLSPVKARIALMLDLMLPSSA